MVICVTIEDVTTNVVVSESLETGAEPVVAEAVEEDPTEDAVTGLPDVAEDAVAEGPVAEDPVAEVAGTPEPVLDTPLLVTAPVDTREEYGKTVVVLDKDVTADELGVPVEADADGEPDADELEAVTGEPEVAELGTPIEVDADAEADADELPRG